MINYYRKMLTIDRLAGKFKLRKYDLAQHSYFTGIFFIHFAKLEGIEYSTEVLETVLSHDLMETLTSDLPWNIKNMSEVTKECWSKIENETARVFPEFQKYSDEAIKSSLTEEQFKLFKCMDYLDLFLFIHEEILLGNVTSEMVEIYERCIELAGNVYKSVDDFMKEKLAIGKARYNNNANV